MDISESVLGTPRNKPFLWYGSEKISEEGGTWQEPQKYSRVCGIVEVGCLKRLDAEVLKIMQRGSLF